MGYEAGHYDIKLNPPTPDMRIKVKEVFDLPQVVAVHSERGFFHDGKPFSALFQPSSSTVNQIAASVSRFGREMPKCASGLFPLFAEKFFERNFEPLNKDERLWESDWYDKCNYSGGRKRLLYKLRRSGDLKDFLANKSFIKDEGYLEPKQARAINSYSDVSKCFLGPLVKSIEKKVFKGKWFVKGQDVSCRPARMMELFGDSPVAGTDFSSFEAHHRGVMAHIMAKFVGKMVKKVATNFECKVLWAMMMGRNICRFKHITTWVNETLMSGALWTSLNNGVLNLVINSFLYARKKTGSDDIDVLLASLESFQAMIEGDDGIFNDFEPLAQDIADLGISLKMDHYPNFGHASFCGVVCDIKELRVMTDPKKFLRGFFWLPARLKEAKQTTRDSYLKCKALSAYHQYKHCPVVGPVSFAVIDKLRHISTVPGEKHLDKYKLENFRRAKQELPQRKCVKVEISLTSRATVESIFGVSVEEQLQWERYDGKRGVCSELPDWLGSVQLEHARDFIVNLDGWRYWVKPIAHHTPVLLKNILENGLKPNIVTEEPSGNLPPAWNVDPAPITSMFEWSPQFKPGTLA